MNPYGSGPQPPVGAAPGAYSGGQIGGYGMPVVPYGHQAYGMQPLPNAWMWRAGNLLCFRREASLGNVCPKTNTEAPASASLSFSWAPPWTALLFLISPLIYIGVYLAIRKTAQVQVPLSPQIMSRRSLRIWLPLGGLLALLVSIGGGVISGSDDLMAVSVLIGLLAFTGSAIAGAVLGRPLKAHLVTHAFVVLSGAHPDYLARLPAGPVPMAD